MASKPPVFPPCSGDFRPPVPIWSHAFAPKMAAPEAPREQEQVCQTSGDSAQIDASRLSGERWPWTPFLPRALAAQKSRMCARNLGAGGRENWKLRDPGFGECFRGCRTGASGSWLEWADWCPLIGQTHLLEPIGEGDAPRDKTRPDQRRCCAVRFSSPRSLTS